VNGVQQIEVMQARIRSCATLPDALAAGFDAFETIRWHARQCEDRAPELFAAFMTTAAAAADGCDAIAAAPSLPPPGRHERPRLACPSQTRTSMRSPMP
jgi:hypothetical protein